MLIALMAIYAVIFAFEVYPILKNREYKKFAVYSTFFAAAAVLGALHLLEIRIPSPAEKIRNFVIWMTGDKS